MLQILLGPDQRTVREAVLGRLCALARGGGDNLVLLVPEQYSHDMERSLCEAGGDGISLSAEVLSFSRLAVRVFSSFGGAARRTLDKGGRLIAMSAALEAVQPRLKLYGAGVKKPDFLERMLAVTDEFRSSRIGASALRDTAGRCEGRLAVKLEELSLILESYETVCATMGQDPNDRLTRLAELLEETDYAVGRHFFALGFTDFTGQELGVLEELMRGGAELTVGLIGGDPHCSAFSVTLQTTDRLKRLAAGCAERAELRRLPARTEEPPGLRHLKTHLFSGGTVPFPGRTDALRLHVAGSVYGACMDAAGKIRRMVRRGMRYREISVCCTDPQNAMPMLLSVLERFSIPAYASGNDAVVDEPVVGIVLAALEAAGGGMEREDVLEFLKSGLSPVTPEECDRLENYALTWNIRGLRWESDWDMHPDGYGAAMDGDAYAKLARLNEIRRRGVTPLTHLRSGLAAARNTAGQVRALYDYMEEIRLGRMLEQMEQKSRTSEQLRRAQEYAQLYELLVGAMEQLAGVLGETVRAPEDFARLFAALLSQYQVGTIPANLDSVTVGSLESARFSEARAVLILGADDGLFPAYQCSTSLLTEQDRRALQKLELNLPSGQDAQMDRRLAGIYSALAAAQDVLILYTCTEQPSYLFTRTAALFPDVAVEEDAGLPEILFSTPESLAALLACREDPSLEPLRGVSEQARTMAERLRSRARYDPGKLAPQTVFDLYGRKLYLSASRIDRYASCRCAYFFDYGLKLQSRKAAAFDAPVYGTFVHAVLERTAAQVKREGGFHAVSEDRLLAIAGRVISEFQDETLQNLKRRSERFTYLFDRNLEEVLDVVRELGRELRSSDFEPAGFEVEFSENGPLPPVEIHGGKASAQVSGFVDRVDLYDCGGVRYVRVVDYKTGKKTFDYTDVLNGIGLQMLVYLFALEESGPAVFGKALQPAGVLYFPARRPLLTAAGKLPPEVAQAKRASELTRRGLLADDEAVLSAMEHYEKTPVYMPYQINAKGERVGDLADPEGMRLLRDYVRQTLEALTDAICDGAVSPNPIVRGSTTSACSYCEYAQVCHRASGLAQERPMAAVTRGEFWEELGRRAKKDE